MVLRPLCHHMIIFSVIIQGAVALSCGMCARAVLHLIMSRFPEIPRLNLT